MTESEAIEKLKNMRLFMQIEDKNNDCKFTEDDYKANEMAIQALEKQIPMKPVRKLRSGMGNDYRDYYCSCGMFIGYEPRVRNYLESGTPPFSYCCNCGQKFDWSDDNEID